MELELDPPNQLSFTRPFDRVVKEILLIKNKQTKAIAFKLKTTAPKHYCVRPNSGVVEPQETKEIQVLLQPMKEDPPADFKCKDKFLVQSIVVTSPDKPLADLWVEASKSETSITERKLKVIYLPAPNDTQTSSSSPQPFSVPTSNSTSASPVTTKDQQPPSYIQPAATTSSSSNKTTSPTDMSSISPTSSTSPTSHSSHQQPTPSITTTDTSQSKGSSQEASYKKDLQNMTEKYKSLQKAYENLQNESTQLRSRGNATSTKPVLPSMPHDSTDLLRIATQSVEQQFSLVVVAVVAFLAFLAGVMFF